MYLSEKDFLQINKYLSSMGVPLEQTKQKPMCKRSKILSATLPQTKNFSLTLVLLEKSTESLWILVPLFLMDNSLFNTQSHFTSLSSHLLNSSE